MEKITKSLSPWASTAANELFDLKPISRKEYKEYVFEICQTHDSVWMLVTWPSDTKVAFRMACIPGSLISVKKATSKKEGFEVDLITSQGDLRTIIKFPEAESTVLHYTTYFRPKASFLIPFWPKDILPFTSQNKIQEEGKIHAQQIGTRSGLIHFSMNKPNIGSVFYFQNLTEINAYFEATKTSAADTVGGNWPELGFSLPATNQDPLVQDQEIVLSDAFIVLSTDVPKNDVQITQQFMNCLASVYQLLDRPEPKYPEWLEIGKAGLEGLSDHKGCWTFAKGHPYLSAYLSDYQTPPEIMVQLAVMIPLMEYCKWNGGKHKIVDELHDGLPPFYDEKLKTVVRWLPALEDQLDKSEEQKRERIMDSWYLHHPLMNLTRLAHDGDQTANELVMNSIEYAIKVAQHFNYEWPVFYRMDTLEVTKAETAPGEGGEKDVPGAYAKLMLEMWMLTKKRRFFNEAKKAVTKLKGLGFDIFYQANNTAFSAVALLRLYKETKEQWYLDLSYCCIASILKNVQLWECNYGNGKHFPTFYSIFPLKDAPYTAAYEEQEVYSTLYGYLQEAAEIEILPSVRLLIGELVRYAIGRMPFYFPPMLPKEMLSETVKTGEIDPNLWIPLEDIHDGWEKSGEVGQEVYGACISFGIIPRQFFKVEGQDFMVFIDYPSVDFKQQSKSVTLQLLGDERMDCRLLLLLKKKKYQFKVTTTAPKQSSQEIKPLKTTAKKIEFNLKGNQLLKISWD